MYLVILPLRGKVSLSLSQLIEMTEVRLRTIYGVRNLSIIERWHLKRCCERIGSLLQAQWRQVNYNDRYLSRIPTPYDEAAWMWVEEATKISSDVLKQVIYRRGCLDRALYQWVLIDRIRAHKVPHEEAMKGLSMAHRPVKL